MKANCSHEWTSLRIHGVYWHFQYVTNLRTEIFDLVNISPCWLTSLIKSMGLSSFRKNRVEWKTAFLIPESTACLFFFQGSSLSRSMRWPWRLSLDSTSHTLLEKKVDRKKDQSKWLKGNFIFIIIVNSHHLSIAVGSLLQFYTCKYCFNCIHFPATLCHSFLLTLVSFLVAG